MTSGFEQLERELLAARQRQTDRGAGRKRRGIPRWLPSRGAVAAAFAGVFAVAVAVAVLVVALLLSGGPREHRLLPPSQQPAVQALVGELGILRQPQTPEARAYNTSKYVTRGGAERPTHRLIPSLTRVVHLPDGGRLFLYVAPSSRQGDRYGLGFTQLSGRDGFGSCCAPPGPLRRPRGPGPDAYASGAHRSQLYFEIVPDGVAQVRWVFPRRARFPPGPGTTPAARFAQPLTVTVGVRDNVAAIRLPQRGAATGDTWFGTNGHVIAIGDWADGHVIIDHTSRRNHNRVAPRVGAAAQLAVFARPATSADALPAVFRAQLAGAYVRLKPNLADSRKVTASDGQTAYLVPGRPADPAVCVINTNAAFCFSSAAPPGAAAVDLCSPTLPLGKLELEWLLPDRATHVALGMSDGTKTTFASGYNVYIARLPLNRSRPTPTTFEWDGSDGQHHSVNTPVPRNAQNQRCAHPKP